MDVEALRTLSTVAEEGTVTAAAARLHLTQPAVSARIRSLERALGTVLIERHGRRSVLTEPAERLLPHIREVLLAVDRGLRAIEHGMPLRVGATPTLGTYLVPHILRLAPRSPDTPIVVRCGHPPELVAALFRREIDVALVRTLPYHGDLAMQFLYAEPLVVAASPSHNLSGRGVEPSALVQYPILRPAKSSYCWSIAVGFLRNHGAEPRTIIDADQTVIPLLRAGLGIGFLPLLVAQEELAAGRLVELHVTGFSRDHVRVPVFAVFRSFDDAKHLMPYIRQAATIVHSHASLLTSAATAGPRSPCAPGAADGTAPRPSSTSPGRGRRMTSEPEARG